MANRTRKEIEIVKHTAGISGGNKYTVTLQLNDDSIEGLQAALKASLGTNNAGNVCAAELLAELIKAQ